MPLPVGMKGGELQHIFILGLTISWAGSRGGEIYQESGTRKPGLSQVVGMQPSRSVRKLYAGPSREIPNPKGGSITPLLVNRTMFPSQGFSLCLLQVICPISKCQTKILVAKLWFVLCLKIISCLLGGGGEGGGEHIALIGGGGALWLFLKVKNCFPSTFPSSNFQQLCIFCSSKPPFPIENSCVVMQKSLQKAFKCCCLVSTRRRQITKEQRCCCSLNGWKSYGKRGM